VWRGQQTGAATAEAALALPLLLLVLLGTIQLALVVHAGHVVTVAAQEGARLAASEDRTPDDGAAHAAALLRAGLGRSAGAFTVGVAYEPPAGDVVVAAVTGVYPTLAPLPGGGWPLRATARVRAERFRAGRM
jgi:Flp pilus assembly protein TadG